MLGIATLPCAAVNRALEGFELIQESVKCLGGLGTSAECQLGHALTPVQLNV